MHRILFVCHGNICRSPMAEFVMKDMVKRAGLSDEFEIASAATSREELGNGVYPPVARILRAHGIDCSGKRARQIEAADYRRWDMIIGMDSANMRNMKYVFGMDEEGRLSRLLDYTDNPHDVDDPWYSGDFETTWREVNEGCAGLLRMLLGKH